MEFSAEELYETIDRLVVGLLEQAGIDTPPIDALYLAREHLGIPVVMLQAPRSGGQGQDIGSYRRRVDEGRIILTAEMTLQQRQKAAAEGIAIALAPQLCRRLGVPFPPAERSFWNHLRTLFAPRLLIPTRMLRAAQRGRSRDLLALQTTFATASAEMIAQRWLDFEDPCVVTIVDDGVVIWRRSNCGVTGKRLLPAEQQCLERIMALEQPQRLRRDGWTVQGWPLNRSLGPRIVLHSVPDEI
jgi:hypothetical protein